MQRSQNRWDVPLSEDDLALMHKEIPAEKLKKTVRCKKVLKA